MEYNKHLETFENLIDNDQSFGIYQTYALS